jgi:Fic family protein
MTEEKYIWKPTFFNENWLRVSTYKLDNILPSWYRKREIFKENQKEYEKFLDELKRKQAIETGIIERLYDLKEGITETFIKEGFVETYLQHGDTNIHPQKLMGYLKDHFDAIDFVFDFVKNNRKITNSFIKELHHLITSHQDTVEAIDQYGNIREVALLKGCYKKLPNNPRRDDVDIKFMYCPPEQVESEMDNLINIYNSLEDKDVHSIIKAAFFHHAFTQIHPFQDGNGRIARLLASLILVKEGLFPFTIERKEKKEYIEALEFADDYQYQHIIDFFSKIQIRNIEKALNWKTIVYDNNLKDVVSVFTSKVKKMKTLEREEREKRINKNRLDVFNYSVNTLNKYIGDIQQELGDLASITVFENKPNDEKYYYFTHQIAEYASHHDYYFNASLPRGWIRANIQLSESKKYNLILSLHHYGYDDSTLAIGAFLEFIDSAESDFKYKRSRIRRGQENIYVTIPLEIRPLTISVELDIEDLKPSINQFVQDSLTVTLAHLSNQI